MHKIKYIVGIATLRTILPGEIDQDQEEYLFARPPIYFGAEKE